MGGAALTWRSKQQVAISTSSVQAEYIALSVASRETLWLQLLFHALGFHQREPTTIYSDAMGAIALASHPTAHTTTKHISVAYHHT
jgi:hypothetical protein